jgi:hypothetical protein
MAKYIFKNKFLAVAISLVFCAVFSTEAFAWQGRSQNGREGNRHNEVQHGMAGHGGGSRGEWRQDDWLWGGVALSALAFGVIIASLPRQHETVYVDSTPSESVEINVPNARGGYTPVVLTRCEGGYVGPQGEYYPGNPTLEQLKALYGQ